MEKANGVELDTLISLLKFHFEHPDDYLTLSIAGEDGTELNSWIKNQSLIEQNSWIKDIENHRELLPIACKRAQNEQAIFVFDGGSKQSMQTLMGECICRF